MYDVTVVHGAGKGKIMWLEPEIIDDCDDGDNDDKDCKSNCSPVKHTNVKKSLGKKINKRLKHHKPEK